MADDIAISPGAGAVVATDESGGRHFQLVKPCFGVDGAATMVSSAAPLPVVLTPSANEADTASVAAVAGSATVVTLLAANANRLGASFYNDSSALLYLKLGTGASTSSFSVLLEGGDYFELQLLAGNKVYTGAITGIWASATGNARVTEVS